MDYKKFVTKYFKGDRVSEIQRNLTPQKYKQLFGQLSKRQMEIISDKDSRCIVVGAGPGSGKTRVLVHKLASLLLLEDVKHEQFLMLTFSRASATEFKLRLMELIGNAAHFIEIKTFHSYCFDLLGRIGNLEDAKNVVAKAAEMISQGEVEPNKIGKTVLVISDSYAKDTHLVRRYYVGITRAKNRLFVHTNGDCFNRLSADRYLIDQQQYDMPEEIVLQLSHKDVYLGFFKERKQEVLALRGGDSLTYSDFFLYSSLTDKPVTKLSLKMQDTLSEWEERGYKVKSASVRFVVAWKPKDAQKDEPETAVLLADLTLSL